MAAAVPMSSWITGTANLAPTAAATLTRTTATTAIAAMRRSATVARTPARAATNRSVAGVSAPAPSAATSFARPAWNPAGIAASGSATTAAKTALCRRCHQKQQEENEHDATEDDLQREAVATLGLTDANAPTLRFSPTAWAKLLFLRDAGDTEVGGFGISAADDLLLIEDVQLVRQVCDLASVAFDDDSVADFFDRQVDAGLSMARCRPSLAAHPSGDSPQPSMTDEETSHGSSATPTGP